MKDTDQKPSYRLRTELQALLGDESRISELADESRLQTAILSRLRSRFGPWKGSARIRLLSATEVELQYFPPISDPRAESLHEAAILATRQKNIQLASRKWEEATLRNPEDAKYWFHAGVANFELRRFEQAREQLIKALALCPFHHRAHLVLGTLYLKLRRLEDAKKHLEVAVELCPRDPLARLNLGAVCSVLRNYEEAIGQFQEALRAMPDDPRPYLGLAKVYSLTGATERAEYYYRQVIRLDTSGVLRRQAQMSLSTSASPAAETEPEPIKPLGSAAAEGPPVGGLPEMVAQVPELQAARLRHSQKDPDTAFAIAYNSYLHLDYPKAVEYYAAYSIRRSADANGWYRLGESALRCGKLVLAARALQMAAQLSPEPTYLKQSALAYLLLGEKERARAQLLKARELGKKDSMFLCLLGEVALGDGDLTSAISALESSVRANRNNVRARLALAKALERSGDLEAALRQLSELLLLPLDTPIREEAEELLQELKERKTRWDQRRGLAV
ncbi:MAG: tetratricopeptide repeat protein [candidate division KSB1 bacterium]|nr:tetratricopeptide repeat protein [candidate division KSB1 bacterium]